tara:strand:+ start:698 stop:1786 length:1089 start_codon:yes stop_codon:yes gene_type:complete
MTKIELTSEQKDRVLKEWESEEDNPPSLLELIRIAYPDKPHLDGRSKEGKAVKTFLATRQIKPLASHQYQPKKIELAEEHKEFINNNFGMMSAVEIARILFKNNELTNLNQESRAVDEYVKTLNSAAAFQQNSEVPEENYKPPKTMHAAITKVNHYVLGGIDKNKLTPKNKKDINSLIGYLHTYRFLHQMNTYENQTDRELFESSFIRYTNDKNDLTQEEVDQYIVLSGEVVIASNIQRRVERLQQHLDAAAEDTEGRRIAMALVESISTAQTEYNQCVNRQQKLLESLKEKRSDKLKKQIHNNASILNLVEIWKEEESRKKMIQLAERRKEVIKDEIDNLTSMDEMKARILGISEDEILNG